MLGNPGAPVQAEDTRQPGLWLNAGQAEFESWNHSGTRAEDNLIRLNPAELKSGRDPYEPGRYQGGNYYNGGAYYYGEAQAPYYSPAGGFDSAVVSWNAQTPAGTWVEVRLRALLDNHWSREYVMGIWASNTSTIRRHSLNGQSDADGRVDTDTLSLTRRAAAFQVRVLLFTTTPGTTPQLSLAAVSTVRNGNNSGPTSSRAAWGVDLPVPERSQMIYPDGGEVWCSPTSSSMVLAYWGSRTGRSELNRTVPAAAAATSDWIYDGNGNWPFNTAYTASFGGLHSYITRLTALSQLEPWIEKGIPVIVSIAYKPGQLTGSPIPQTNGHLLVVRGFDRSGNVITNDPAGDPRQGQNVRIVYNRTQFEQRWLAGSGGAVYLSYPETWPTPARAVIGWSTAAAERNLTFADPAIEAIWQGADLAVANGRAGRSWLWGPSPASPARLESYAEGPAGQRLVQYFDKSRMEITRPQADRQATWFVTNGLLTVELVTGQMQLGDNQYRPLAPADIPVAGDSSSPLAPTYATFRALASVEGKQDERRAPDRTGQPLTTSLSRSGQTGQHSAGASVKAGHYEPTLGHNIPDVLWSWMNDPARSGLVAGWLFALGYPLTEPYWVQINLNGQPATVLVQLFERRALTYTPGNPAAFQIEMGNIGQHYMAWRYK